MIGLKIGLTKGAKMNIDERLKYAENRRDDSITNGTSYDCAYWNGYLDGLKAVKEDSENEQRKADV